MGDFLGGVLLPLLLLTAALLNWSLISLIDLLSFLVIQYNTAKGLSTGRDCFSSWFIIIFSILALASQVAFYIIWVVEGEEQDTPNAGWTVIIGFLSVQPLRSSFLQLSVVFVALLGMYWSKFNLNSWGLSCWDHFSSYVEHLGSQVEVVCRLLLPAVQLVAGISHPSWISLPFFICSCAGLVDWSLTSNFSGLFRWRRPLLLYAGFMIVLLYIYQLPVQFPHTVKMMAHSFGLYKVSAAMEWPQICSSLSLIIFYFMLSSVRYDLEEMDITMSMRKSNLTEQLLPSKHSFFVGESRSAVRHTNVLRRGAVFRTFCINFFAYGFPVSLLALSYWSLWFRSIFAFGLLAYVGYILYAFPSVFDLHRLNGSLLVFILFWGFCTYVFNVTFMFLSNELKKDTEIWETIGFWHYPVPGLFLLALFCLGVLVAVVNLVNNSVFLYQSNEDGPSLGGDYFVEDKEETKVLIIATIAWGLRKSSRVITLTLIFLIAVKPGIVHALYMVFFLIYLLSPTVSKKILRSLILLCEAHFGLLYILQLDLVSKALMRKESFTMEVLSQLGFQDHASSLDFLQIAVLLCFSAVHNHGSKMLFSTAVVQHTPYPPVGFSILRAGLNRSVLLSVYATSKTKKNRCNSSHGRSISTYLTDAWEAFLSMYHSCGTYVAFLTVLITVYLISPNYISLGYLFFLLLWIGGRQIIERTNTCLWFPLKVYSVLVFISIYSLSIFTSFQTWLSGMIDLNLYLGYDPQVSLLQNVWESLGVLIVMQLYSYERRQSTYNMPEDLGPSKPGVFEFFKRLLIWHSEKILSLAVFYASLSPISAFGFVYLLGLVFCAALPKTSRLPSKLFLAYTGFLVILEYLYQLLGNQVGMFPGQPYASLSLVLGLQLFGPGFWGLELGLRGKVLVIVASTLQYNAFHWLDTMPNALLNRGKWEEPCQLFNLADDTPHTSKSTQERTPSDSFSKSRDANSKSTPSFDSVTSQVPEQVSYARGSESDGHSGYYLGYTWGSSEESHKWKKKRILTLKKERFDMQKSALKVYLKFWIENMFRLFGLEINMIALLLASFALLNAISLIYIAFLASCVLLGRRLLCKLWLLYVITFAFVLFLEYFFLWRNQMPWNQHASSEKTICCHDCWRSSFLHFNYCRNCWLGFIVDEPRMLISYYAVFMLACFKLRADHLTSFAESRTYRQVKSQHRNALFWRDLSFEFRSLWTLFDYLRLYCYCHLLDIVLALVLITGTLEYDILHIGYLGFALVFFRIRLQILKKKNKVFKFLRMYNFALIVLSLAYQSPFVGNIIGGRSGKFDYLYEMIGFYKYDYGFRVTSRSALVEIIIFMLVSLQSYMFSSQDFHYVSRYLEAEQIGAVVREQEKKAAWKIAQLLHIRKSEEQNHQRNLQVEKMKAEMLNLQIQLPSMRSMDGNTSEKEGLRHRRQSSSNLNNGIIFPDKEGIIPTKHETHSLSTFESHGSPTTVKTSSTSSVESPRHTYNSLWEITELIENDSQIEISDSDRNDQEKRMQMERSPFVSAVQLIGDGVSQVQIIGNQAVANLVSFLNISHEDLDLDGHSAEDDLHYEIGSQKWRHERLERISSVQSNSGMTGSESASEQIGRIFRYVWAQIQSNNDVVCYCCFVLIFLWNFSLLSMVYLAALFLYALCVYTGPTYMFWVIMLIYTELYILVQYLYQIIIHHYVLNIHWRMLHDLGFPDHKITSSFVISSWPLFLVYLFTLLQNCITAPDGEWDSLAELEQRRNLYQDGTILASSWEHRVWQLISPATRFLKLVIRKSTWYWKSLTQGAESPPHFLQISMEVKLWPEDGIQPERIESAINKLLSIFHKETDEERKSFIHSACPVRVQSIERSQENPHLVLVVLEVVYASPLQESAQTEWLKSLTPAADVAKDILKAQHAGLDAEIGFPYPIISVIGGRKREIDLYAYIFGADLAVFFLVAIFYHSIMKNSNELLEVYQLEDQFPKEFVFILMVLFFLIVLDRFVYLCSFATGKVLFYLFNLTLFTYSVTKYAWHMEPSQKHVGAVAIRAIYFTKAISLALHAIQIRYGISRRSTLYRQFLTSKVSRIYYLGFRLYRVLPFLYELRCVLDWSCTTTALTMYDWLKLEDIYSSLYLVKCDADLNRSKHQHGQKQTKMTKFCNGICLFFILICVIWAPMLMYSSGNPTNIANPINDASVRINIKTARGMLTLYQTTLCKRVPWRDFDVNAHLDSQGYLDAYNVEDIQVICCESDASTLWTIPPVIQDRFAQSVDLHTNVIFSWILTRARPKGKEVVKYEIIADPPPNPLEVQAALNGTANSFRVYDFYPRYFRVTGSGDFRFLEQTVDSVSGDILMNRGIAEWWSFHDINASDIGGCGGSTGPMAVVVSEETPQGILGETLSKFSIWGLYISFVLAVGRFIRLQCSDLRMRIPFENLPSCDRLIAICEDIYAARAEGELEVEEVLYWTLVKIYRSPHILLEYTKAN